MHAGRLKNLSWKLNVQVLNLALAGELRGRPAELIEIADVAHKTDHGSLLIQGGIHEQTPHRDLRLIEIAAHDLLQDRNAANQICGIGMYLQAQSSNLGKT